MIPALLDHEDGPGWPLLPPGIHNATLDEVERAFATTGHRRWLFSGLVRLLADLAAAGCRCVFLNGSFVTGKTRPRDFDICWDPIGVDFTRLPDCLKEAALPQRRKIKGEYLGDAFMVFHPHGGTYLESFQIDPATGLAKGVLRIALEQTDE